MEHHYAGIVIDLRAGGSECGDASTSEALSHQDQIAQRIQTNPSEMNKNPFMAQIVIRDEVEIPR